MILTREPERTYADYVDEDHMLVIHPIRSGNIVLRDHIKPEPYAVGEEYRVYGRIKLITVVGMMVLTEDGLNVSFSWAEIVELI